MLLSKESWKQRKEREQRTKQYTDEQNRKLDKMVQYKILEEDKAKGFYQFTGEFVDHCQKFKRKLPLTNYEIEYIETHQEGIMKDYTKLAIRDDLLDWLNDDKLHSQFWDEWLWVIDLKRS